MKLFAFPYAGGSGFSYWGWKPYLMAELIPLEYAGHGGRANEPLNESIEEMAEDMCFTIMETLTEQNEPFTLFGHSMGGVVAFVTAQKLSEKGYVAKHLILSCSSCLASILANSVLDEAEIVQDFIPASILEHEGGSLNQMNSHSFQQRFLPLLRHDIMLSRRCRLSAPLTIPTILIYAQKDCIVSEKSVMKWTEFCDVKGIHMVRGNHFYFEQEMSCNHLFRIINGINQLEHV